MFIGASNELGAFESGVAARVLGLPWAIAGGRLISVAIAASFGLIFPSLCKIDTYEEVTSTEPSPTPI